MNHIISTDFGADSLSRFLLQQVVKRDKLADADAQPIHARWRLHSTASRYLAEELCYVADMPVGDRSSPVVDLQSAGCPTVTPRYCC